MQVLRLYFLSLILIGCANTPSKLEREPAATREREVAELTEILRPHVKILERDTWTFRWEQRDPSWSPRTVADVNLREAEWAKRFFDASVKQGADVGPGVYVAVEPVGSSTWGKGDPVLFAIQIKNGSRVLMGDVDVLNDDDTRRLKRM